MFFKKIAVVLFTAFLCCGFILRGGLGVGIPVTSFTHDQIGGAALITGVSSVPSANLLFARNDQYGCYKSASGGNWQQLVTVQAMPNGTVTLSNGATQGGNGCEELVGDTLNTTNLWLGWNGSVFVSTNSGASFATTCYPAQTPIGNSNVRTMGRRIAVDPANSSITYMSTPSSSLEVTFNQGSTCSAVSGLATPTTFGGTGAGYLIAFDSSGGTTTSCAGSASVCTKNIYVGVYGTGVYESTNGGQSWTLTTGTPTTIWYMIVDATGVVWLVDNSNGSGSDGVARKYNGTWSSPTFTGNNTISAVAYDPNNCTSTSNCHVTFLECCGIGKTANSVNGGTAWVVATSVSITSSDVGWISAWVTAEGMFPSGAAYDNAGNLITGSEGAFSTVPPTTAVAVTYASKTAGFEGFLATQIATSPGTSGGLTISGWDVGCFTLSAPYNSFPGSGAHGCNGQPVFQHAYSVDWAAGTNTTFNALVDNQQGYGGGTYTGYSGTSTNSGGTWPSTFSVSSTITSGGFKGGCMTTGTSPSTIMWAPTDGSGGNVAPLYSSNGGSSWASITVTNRTVTGGWPWQYFLNSHQCASDRVTANTFYFYNWGTGSGSPGDAIIACTGAGCTSQSSPGLGGSGVSTTVNPTLKAVPGQAGYLFLAYGNTGGSQVDVSTNGFYYYTDSGVTKNTISGATNVTAFGFGAAFPGHTFPAIVFSGFYNHVWGIWRSIDWDTNKTWQQIGTYLTDAAGNQYPLDILDIDGDKGSGNYGVFHYGTVSGVFCGALSTSQCNGST